MLCTPLFLGSKFTSKSFWAFLKKTTSRSRLFLGRKGLLKSASELRDRRATKTVCLDKAKQITKESIWDPPLIIILSVWQSIGYWKWTKVNGGNLQQILVLFRLTRCSQIPKGVSNERKCCNFCHLACEIYCRMHQEVPSRDIHQLNCMGWTFEVENKQYKSPLKSQRICCIRFDSFENIKINVFGPQKLVFDSR